MRKRNNKKNPRFKARTDRPQAGRRAIDMKPEDLVVYIHRAEKEAIPLIKKLEMSAGIAIFLLAQYTQVFATGNSTVTPESAKSIASRVIELWGTGFYQPGPDYPFTLEETRQDLQNGIQSRQDYSESFQPFTPINPTPPRGIGQVAGGIVQHPKTLLWQIWMMLDGPCEFLGAYRDPSIAKEMLEEIINITRQGKGPEFAKALYQKITSKGDGEPQQISFDMMAYLLDHIDQYNIEL